MSERNGSPDEHMRYLAIQQEVSVQHSAAPGMLKLWSNLPCPQEIRLKEVIAIIRPQQWSNTKFRIQRLRIQAFTHTRVLGRGRERGLRYLPRKGATHGMGIRYLPKQMISWVVEEAQVEPLIQAIIETNQTGQLGDGKIFVLPVEDAVRIRTEDRGYDAVRSERPLDITVGTPCQSVASEVAHA